MFIQISKIIAILLCVFCSKMVFGQCQNNTLNPLNEIVASQFNDTVLVATNSKAGQYYIVNNLALNKTYRFTVSGAGHYITIRNKYTNELLGQGAAPYDYSIGAGPDVVAVHVNLVTPPCGTSNTNRVTRVICTNCNAVPPKAGVSVASPTATFEVGGEIKLGFNTRNAEAGMIRWNNVTNDFEGYNGSAWLSLTKGNASWGTVSQQQSNENQKIYDSVGEANQLFGTSLSMTQNVALIGSAYDEVGGNALQGSVYFYNNNNNNWSLLSKLNASDGDDGDLFGFSCKIENDYAIIGATGDDVGGKVDQGSAYIFVRNGNTWTQQAKLVASDGEAGDFFGVSVSLYGDYAVVGAYLDDVSGNVNQGSAYVFVRDGTTWLQQAKILPNNLNSDNYFGKDVSIFGDYLAVGAPLTDISGNTNQGAAFIFTRSGNVWSQQERLLASAGATEDEFGGSISLYDNYVLVGSSNDDVNSNFDQGSAYVFKRNGNMWTEQAQLVANDGAEADFFGFSVSLYGNIAVVGCHGTDVFNTTNAGSAYVFGRSGDSWGQQTKLLASDGASNDALGATVSIFNTNILLGAFQHDLNGNENQGAVYFFKK